MDSEDLRFFVKSYLDRKGVKSRLSDGNLPSYKWVATFLQRHPEFTLRKTTAIKTGRARVSRTEIRKFFDHYLKEVEGVPPENISNYDETSFADDPKIKRCVFKKGTKHPEKIMNTSKQNISVMFCGSASGKMLPPFIVYKVQNVYHSWTLGGPKGTVYSCSPSGWCDGFNFRKWFFEDYLPDAKRKVGKKVLIGDNLSSHISDEVIDSCRKNNIAFICLPPNSTDKLQPLDVGVFKSLKSAWKDILSDFKKKHPKETGIAKNDFPRLLKEAIKKSDPERHLPKAFEKCGLFPASFDKAVECIPFRDMECSESVRDLLNSTLGEKLEELRGYNTEKKSRGKKIKVPAGKSYTHMEEEEEEEEEDEEEEEEVDPDQLLTDSEEELLMPRRKIRVLEDEDEELEDEDEELPNITRGPEYAIGSFVVAVYDQEWYIAMVEGEEPEEEVDGFTMLKYMERRGDNQFVWGTTKDTLKTNNKDILIKVDPPVPVSSRLFGLPKTVVKEVEMILRVMWSIILYFYWPLYLKTEKKTFGR